MFLTFNNLNIYVRDFFFFFLQQKYHRKLKEASYRFGYDLQCD
jgi:hypothetical protein